MKKITLIIFSLLIIFSTFCYGQKNRLIFPKQVTNAAEKSNDILEKGSAYVSVDFVEINLEILPNYEEFIIQFGEKNISVVKERIIVRDINNFSFVASNNEYCRILISVLDGDIQGVIETMDAVFSVKTIGANEYAIVKVDQSKICEECEELIDENNSSKFIDDEIPDKKFENDSTISYPIKNTAKVYECKLRVLVLCTTDALSHASNIKNMLWLAVDLTNQSFINSNIDYEIELVYSGVTKYGPSCETGGMLRKLIAPDDGFFDEIHTLRDTYSADICVLLYYCAEDCGMVPGFGVSADSAFCVVNINNDCLTTNYSLGHEIGHLLGCRHQLEADPRLYPFEYGHGYVHPEKKWRTIMAIPTQTDTCLRIQYWSNPNLFYNGDPMGTEERYNSARVWNEQSNYVMTFRQPKDTLIITKNEILHDSEGDIIAKQDIITNGTVNITNEGNINMRAGNAITFFPGFSSHSGSVLSAKIEEIFDCGETPEPPRILIQSMLDDKGETDEVLINGNIKIFDFTYKVFPNPSQEWINIQYSLITETQLDINLVNFLGQRVKSILPKQKQLSGSYELQIPVTDLAKGTYFLTIISANQKNVEKIIITE